MPVKDGVRRQSNLTWLDGLRREGSFIAIVNILRSAADQSTNNSARISRLAPSGPLISRMSAFL